MSSPVLHYAFNGTDLTIDSSSTGANLTNTDVTMVTDSERGNVASFNGTTSQMVLSSTSVPTALTGDNTRTIMCWINHTEYVSSPITFQYVYFTGENIGTDVRYTAFINEEYNIEAAGSAVREGTPVANEWHHFASTYDGNFLKLYIDGVELGSDSRILTTELRDMFIGSHASISSWKFSGLMSDFKVYDTALTEAEIVLEMNVVSVPNPIRHYPLNDEATLLQDISGNSTGSLTNVNSVSTVEDSEFGTVASFNGGNYFLVEVVDVPPEVYGLDTDWSYSFWAKNNDVSTNSECFSIGENSTSSRITGNVDTDVFLGYNGSNSLGSEVGPMNLMSDIWYHYCFVRNGNNFKFYIDGVLVINHTISGIDPTQTTFKIGTNHDLVKSWNGFMADVRIYDLSLTSTEIGEIFSNPPTPDSSSSPEDETPNDMTGNPGVFFMELSWSPRNLARSYRIDYTGTDGSEGAFITSAITTSIGSLTPNTEYVFTLFSSEGISFVSYGSPGTFSTLENLESNHDLTYFQDSATGTTDLSSLNIDEIEVLDEHLNELLETGDIVAQNVLSGSLQTTFIKRGDTLDTSSSGGTGSFSVPFTPSAGSNQVATISTGTSDIVVSYDETTDRVVVDGTSYSNGDSLIVDGKKMVVHNL